MKNQAVPKSGPESEAYREFAADVRRDLSGSPKQLQPKYFYDAVGSYLFEAICNLPWYEITRGEQRLLERCASEMLAPVAGLTEIVELGCGSGAKLALLCQGLKRGASPVLVRLIDISPTALELSERTIDPLPQVESVIGHHATYSQGLRDVRKHRPARGRALVLLLGSNIGNLRPPAADAFLQEIRAALRPGDAFLLGADLVKPEPDLLRAYGDPIGVTSAFNKNLLARINRELGGDFDLEAFAHRPRWNEEASRVESHLVSLRAQTVTIPGADVTVSFAENESIWTESSYKYTPERLTNLGRAAGFECAQQWVDPASQFALSLFLAS